MHTLELLPNLPELTVEESQRWVSAALAEAHALRQHDGRLYPLNGDAKQMATANGLHAAWQRWADDAEDLLTRIGEHQAQRESHKELRLAIGYARCLNQLPAEEALRRHRSVNSGEAAAFSIQEARRELGLTPLG
ncbi:MAG TPA: hypothetical protein VFC78_14740 [Tepidisphaeraceae bacterium]|nr:hypothetical protein [Tepidisphaeraceae bacterium]